MSQFESLTRSSKTCQARPGSAVASQQALAWPLGLRRSALTTVSEGDGLFPGFSQKAGKQMRLTQVA